MRTLQLSKDARRFLEKLQPKVAERISNRILALADDPVPHDAKHLKGSGFLRIRIGDHRVVYSFGNSNVIVALVEKRDVVYKRLRR